MTILAGSSLFHNVVIPLGFRSLFYKSLIPKKLSIGAVNSGLDAHAKRELARVELGEAKAAGQAAGEAE
jgi:hypothetical protein